MSNVLDIQRRARSVRELVTAIIDEQPSLRVLSPADCATIMQILERASADDEYGCAAAAAVDLLAKEASA
jgi:hypothetical protein